MAESAESEGDIFSAVKYHLLSPEPEKALPIGIAFVKGRCFFLSVEDCFCVEDAYIRIIRIITQ